MDSAAVEHPRVSLLLAVRNEEQRLPACLAAIAAQCYPARRLELIVADGESADATRALVRRFAATVPFRVRLLQNRRHGTAAGFNLALQAAAGEVVVILGARARLAPNFLAQSVAVLRESGADAAGGVVRGEGSGVQARAVALALASPFGVGGARYRYSRRDADVDTVNYGAYHRCVFEQIGGFDETMANVEDDEFNYRLRAAGGRLRLSPRIQGRYALRGSLGALLRQYLRYGYPKVRVLRRHPRQMQPRQFAPAALVLTLLLGTLAAPLWRPARRLLALVAGTYTLALLGVSLRLARRAGPRAAPLLPAAFAAMHLGYGVASLAGGVRFLLLPSLLRLPEPSRVPAIGPAPAWLPAEGEGERAPQATDHASGQGPDAPARSGE